MKLYMKSSVTLGPAKYIFLPSRKNMFALNHVNNNVNRIIYLTRNLENFFITSLIFQFSCALSLDLHSRTLVLR